MGESVSLWNFYDLGISMIPKKQGCLSFVWERSVIFCSKFGSLMMEVMGLSLSCPKLTPFNVLTRD